MSRTNWLHFQLYASNLHFREFQFAQAMLFAIEEIIL